MKPRFRPGPILITNLKARVAATTFINQVNYMDKRDYEAEKADKRKSTKSGILFLLVFITLFVTVMVRIAARSDSNNSLFSFMPSGNDAYEIAQDYIKPTLKFPDAEFPKDAYQYTSDADSVYVVKAWCYSGKNKAKTNFTVTLKYTGGVNSDGRNWELVNLRDHE
jgi:hypothetical protein